MIRAIAPVSPSEMLEEEFLKPLGLTKYRLAKDMGVPPQRIGDIVAGKRSITADTDLRLCKYFGLSDGWWLRGQANYDTAIARESLSKVLRQIDRTLPIAGSINFTLMQKKIPTLRLVFFLLTTSCINHIIN